MGDIFREWGVFSRLATRCQSNKGTNDAADFGVGWVEVDDAHKPGNRMNIYSSATDATPLHRFRKLKTVRTNDNEWKTQEEVASVWEPEYGIREENELNLMDPVVFPESFRVVAKSFAVVFLY